jgi:replicative DNA helicase
MAKQENEKGKVGLRAKKGPQKTEDTGRKLPQAMELEEAVLGALMLEKDAFFIISDVQLTPECFYYPAHQMIFRAIQSLAAKQLPIDILTVVEQLKRDGCLDEAGGAPYIAELSQRVLSGAHVDYHARIVMQKHIARELINYSNNVIKDAFDEMKDVDELMQEAEGRLFEITQRNIKKDAVHIAPILKEAHQKIREAAAREGLSGLESGFTDLDRITMGWQPSDLIIIAARPAMGKTALVLSMLRNMAVNYKTPVAMFSLEMPDIQLVNRLIVNVAELEGEKIRSGQLVGHEWDQLDFKVAELYEAPIYIDDTASLSVFELRSKARRLVREHGVKCIFIDYLQLMNASGMQYNNRQEEVTHISKSLKALAKELQIPIIALSQLNRSTVTRTGTGKETNLDINRPQLSDLRESGSIEQDADIVCFIHRPEYYKILEDESGRDLRGKAYLLIAKHRNGKTGDVLLEFQSQFVRFRNLEESSLSAEIASRAGNLESEMPPETDYSKMQTAPY